jgi:polyvinyl alcohol dehydrogenase (cytochrome)
LSFRTSRRRVLAASALPAVLAVTPSAFAQDATPASQATPIVEATPAPATTSGWPLYGNTITGTKSTTSAGISSANVANLQALWQIEVGGAVSSTPVIANGVVYAASYDGNLYAVNLATGESVWTYATGAAVPEPNLGIPLGVTGSAAVDGTTVYVGDAAAVVHAIDAATGTSIWTTTVDDQPNASIWSSPVIWNGTLYIGVASVAKEAGFRGSVIALDAATGEVVWQTYMVPEGADGAGVFAVPAIDEARGVLYVGTQNAYSPNPGPFGNPISVVALNAASGEEVWVYASPVGDGSTAPTDDVGFSASPNLFTIEFEGQQRDVVGIGQKSGEFWTLDRETGEVVWQATVSPAGFLGGMEGTSAFGSDIVVVPATDWPEFEGEYLGLVSAYDAGTGLRRWTVEQEAPAASPVAISDDIVFHAGMDGILHAYIITNGIQLWSADLGSSASGGVAVADGVVVVGAATPEFAPFVKAGSTIQAFGLVVADEAPAATPVVATPVS